jgi:uncharacterized coiled-coil protein SlyX
MKNNSIMNIENKIKDVIDMLEDAISFEDWRMVENAQKELTFLYEEMESSFPLDEYDDEEID